MFNFVIMYCIRSATQRKSSWFLMPKDSLLTPKVEALSSRPSVVEKTLKEDTLSSPETKKNNTMKEVKKSRSSKFYDTICNYLDSKDHLRDIKSRIPNEFLMREFSALATCFYLVDREISKVLFDTLKHHLNFQKTHVLECNAGLGLLTTHLLKANLPRLRIYEQEPRLLSELQELVEQHGSNALVIRGNLLYLNLYMYLDREDNGNRFNDMFGGISPEPWEDEEPVIQMILAVPDHRFVIQIMVSMVHQSGICSLGRPEFFFIMPPSTYEKLAAKPELGPAVYRSKSVLFQTFFDHSVLATVPAKTFVPWVKKAKFRGDNDIRLVVKLTAKQNLLQMFPPHHLKPFFFFIRVMMQKRKASLISTIERWIPGFGVELVAQGYTVFTQCGSLSPEEWVKVFQMFISHPEYKPSSFHSSMESDMCKMQSTGDFEDDQTKKKFKGKDKIINLETEEMDLEFNSFDEIDENLNKEKKLR